MSPAPVRLRGHIAGGPTLHPPYVSDRCVVWASTDSERPGPRGGGIEFTLRLEDGRELRVEVSAAAAQIPVRREFSYTASGGRGRVIEYRVGWLAPGDAVTITADSAPLEDASPFRAGIEVVRALGIAADGATPGATLEVPSLLEGEPEE